jgi:hypothetical protein
MKYMHTKHRTLRHIPVLPFIYAAAVFIILLDIWVELYHRVSFPLYGFGYVKRRNYIKIDRHKLKYLNIMEKFNCIYCGYANGVIHYISKIMAETERYWCGIKHARRDGFIAPAHHQEFIDYGDEEQFKTTYLDGKTRML